MGSSVASELLAPRYLVAVEGTKLKSDVTAYVASVEYEEEENAAARVTLEVLNHEFRFLDERVFAEGNELDLWLGYTGRPLHHMNRCVIVSPDPRFPRSGIPRLTVTAHDASRNLMSTGDKDRGKTYPGTRDSDVVTKVLKEEGIEPFVFPTTGTVTRVRRRGQTRWEFLRELARLHNFAVWVRYDAERRRNVGYFGPVDMVEQPVRHRFVYGTGEADATLLEFDPKVGLASQSTEVEIAYVDPSTRKLHSIRCEVKRKDAERTRFMAVQGRDKLRERVSNGPSVTLTCLGQREEVIADRAFASPAEAKRFAAAWFDARQRDFVTGQGVLLGSPDVRLGQVHEFAGLGPRLSGDWILTRVCHRMSGSSMYETEFTAQRKVLKSVVGSPDGTSNVRAEDAET